MKWSLPALAALLLFYPFIFSGAFYCDIGVAFLLAAISASAWNIVGGYAGPGVGRPQHVLRRRRLYAAALLSSVGLAADRGRSRRHRCVSLVLAVVDRHADLSPAGTLLQHGDDRGRRTDPHLRRHLGLRRRGDRPAGTGGGARLVGPHLPQRAAVLLHLSRRAGGRAAIRPSRSSAAASAIICARSRPASAPRAASACRCGRPSSRR